MTRYYTSQITIRHTKSSQTVTDFTSRCVVAAYNSWRSLPSGFPNCPWSQLLASHSLDRSSPLTNLLTNSMTDGQSARLSWCQASIWGLRPEFCYCQTIAGLLMWGALSYERTGMSLTIAPDPRQSSLSRVRVLRDLWQYFTDSGSRLLKPEGPGPRIYMPPKKMIEL
jgi:hypothetical protein